MSEFQTQITTTGNHLWGVDEDRPPLGPCLHTKNSVSIELNETHRNLQFSSGVQRRSFALRYFPGVNLYSSP